MEIFSGKVDGSLDVNAPYQLNGMVAGDLNALSGAEITLNGMVVGDLIVLKGAFVSINGMVNGAVIARGGDVEIYGHCARLIIEDDSSNVTVSPDAFIGGER
ncbi:hypothetical protein [Celeribacter halophilus]|uniref:hypothetical protein n=1 Tax=Celeribacter halophilus TaxID=576117 RepID=UPI003A90FEC0